MTATTIAPATLPCSTRGTSVIVHCERGMLHRTIRDLLEAEANRLGGEAAYAPRMRVYDLPTAEAAEAFAAFVRQTPADPATVQGHRKGEAIEFFGRDAERVAEALGVKPEWTGLGAVVAFPQDAERETVELLAGRGIVVGVE